MEYVVLNNKVKMPKLGYGVFQIPNDECEACVSKALAAGYRLIDTASAYLNEEAVGEAIKKSDIPREELFITTKLWVQDSDYDLAIKAAEASMKRLGVDYIDLYLIHQPFGDYYSAWRAMEKMYCEGKIRAIGTSNFDEARLVDLCMNNEIKPAVNQVEIQPFFQQEKAIKNMQKYNIQPEAWGPLSEGQKNIFCNMALDKIASKYQKSVAQIILRWNIQRNVVVIPGTINEEHLKENIDIWDFSLNDDDMKAISKLDIGYSEIINYYSACTAKVLNEVKIRK